jgi:UDP-2,3-diacylglucosamine pyrophosphatase LpxH
MKPKRRDVDILVLSDIHLGTFGCHARELLQYLRTINPRMVILNGDIIDGWQFSKRYFPGSHIKVVRHILNWLSKGVRVYYIPGNHDEFMRRYKAFRIGSFRIVNKLKLTLDGKTYWFFHGDVFDMVMKYSKWLARLGGWAYDLLIMLNTLVNRISSLFGRGKVSLSAKVKSGVKGAVKFINHFEETAAGIAARKGFHAVVCGHIHEPVIRGIETRYGHIIYLNSGDWIENMTSLEYTDGRWTIHRYANDMIAQKVSLKKDKSDKKIKHLYKDLLSEFSIEE